MSAIPSASKTFLSMPGRTPGQQEGGGTLWSKLWHLLPSGHPLPQQHPCLGTRFTPTLWSALLACSFLMLGCMDSCHSSSGLRSFFSSFQVSSTALAAASVWKAEGCFSDSRISFPLFYPVGFHKYFMSTFLCQASFLFEAEDIQNNPINVWPQKETKTQKEAPYGQEICPRLCMCLAARTGFDFRLINLEQNYKGWARSQGPSCQSIREPSEACLISFPIQSFCEPDFCHLGWILL